MCFRVFSPVNTAKVPVIIFAQLVNIVCVHNSRLLDIYWWHLTRTLNLKEIRYYYFNYLISMISNLTVTDISGFSLCVWAHVSLHLENQGPDTLEQFCGSFYSSFIIDHGPSIRMYYWNTAMVFECPHITDVLYFFIPQYSPLFPTHPAISPL